MSCGCGAHARAESIIHCYKTIAKDDLTASRARGVRTHEISPMPRLNYHEDSLTGRAPSSTAGVVQIRVRDARGLAQVGAGEGDGRAGRGKVREKCDSEDAAEVCARGTDCLTLSWATSRGCRVAPTVPIVVDDSDVRWASRCETAVGHMSLQHSSRCCPQGRAGGCEASTRREDRRMRAAFRAAAVRKRRPAAWRVGATGTTSDAVWVLPAGPSARPGAGVRAGEPGISCWASAWGLPSCCRRCCAEGCSGAPCGWGPGGRRSGGLAGTLHGRRKELLVQRRDSAEAVGAPVLTPQG